jgi:hypothetical protein
MRMPSPRRAARLAVLLSFALVLAAVPAEAQVFYLTSKSLVPPRNLGSWGSCVARVDTPFVLDATLSISCTHNVNNPVAAWVGKGRAGQGSTQVLTFSDPDAGVLADEWVLTEQQQVDLLVGNYHLVIASDTWPMGEVRGQLENLQFPVSVFKVYFPLETSQLQPEPATTAHGRCMGLYDPAFPGTSNDQVEMVLLCTHDVQDATSAELRLGLPGMDGPLMVDMGTDVKPLSWGEQWDPGDEPYPGLGTAIARGQVYVLLRSAAFPNGVLRGQVEGCAAAPDALCLNEDRFRVTVTWADSSSNQGNGQAVPVNADSGLFWFFNPNNLEMLVKVLNGCPVNGHYWVFSAATTNVAYTLTVEDTVSGEQVSYGNELGTPAVTRLDSTAFDTCP